MAIDIRLQHFCIAGSISTPGPKPLLLQKNMAPEMLDCTSIRLPRAEHPIQLGARMPKSVSLTAAAKTLGLSRNTLAGFLDRGCPYVEKADRARGMEWKIDPAAVFKWRVDTAIKDAVAGYQIAGAGVSKDEADRRRAVALAIVAEIEADTALKSVVARADVESLLADFCQALRSGLANVGSKIANRTAQMTRPAEIRDFCQKAVNDALGAAEADLKEAWERDEGGRLDPLGPDDPDGGGE